MLPLSVRQYPALDILRGFAICGIMFTNILTIGGYVFLPDHLKAYFSSTALDQWIIFLIDVFGKYKFYSLFSLLFGIGFSIILLKNEHNSNFIRTYLTRLALLFLLGWIHASFFSGDILRLYALAGVFLLCFRNLSNRNLLIAALASFSVSIIISIFESTGYYFNPTLYFPFSQENLLKAIQYGPLTDLFAAQYDRTFYYMADNLISRRFFKILGLFLIGLYIGRSKIIERIEPYLPRIKHILPWAWAYSLSINVILIKFATDVDPFIRELLYTISVYPMTFTYVLTFVYFYHSIQIGIIGKSLGNIGRMALSCYIGQNILALMFMLWFGFALGGKLHITEYFVVATIVVTLLIIFSTAWLRYFRLGPLEYCIRKATKYFNR